MPNGHNKNMNHKEIGTKRIRGSGGRKCTNTYRKMKVQLNSWTEPGSSIPNWGILYRTGNTSSSGLRSNKKHAAFKKKSKKILRRNNRIYANIR